jgi:hypothetical protein
LNETNKPVGYDNRPKHSIKYTINDKTKTANHVDHPDFSYIFQYETQYDKKRSRIADVIGNFRIHGKI